MFTLPLLYWNGVKNSSSQVRSPEVWRRNLFLSRLSFGTGRTPVRPRLFPSNRMNKLRWGSRKEPISYGVADRICKRLSVPVNLQTPKTFYLCASEPGSIRRPRFLRYLSRTQAAPDKFHTQKADITTTF